MGSSHRWPWQEREPHTAKSSPSLLALHAALRDPGLATVLCPEARLDCLDSGTSASLLWNFPYLQTYIPLAPAWVLLGNLA